MLTFLLSLLGGGGAIGAALFFFPGLRQILGQLFGAIPPRVLWALVAMAAILGAVLWHNHAVESAREAGVEAGKLARDSYWKDEIAFQREAARNWKTAVDHKSATISILKGQLHDQELRDNSAVADDLRLRGPGKAGACPGRGGDPGVPARAGANGQPAAPADAPPGEVPDGDRNAIVPWGWLVARAEDHDELLSEVKTWRSWHRDQQAAHAAAVAALKRQLPDPAFGGDPPPP